MRSLEDREFIKGVLDEIQDRLKGRQLEIFKFMRLGYSQTDIAKMLGISKNTVYKAMYRIREKCQGFSSSRPYLK